MVNITGDGSFGFTLNELDTARRARLPVLTIIHNNAAWGIIRSGQRAQLDFEFGTSLEGTDYAAIARGFGCFGEVVTRARGRGAGDGARAGLGPAGGAGLPHALRAASRRPGLRQHEPLRLRRAHAADARCRNPIHNLTSAP